MAQPATGNSVVKVNVKWGKQKYDGVELNLEEAAGVFKAQLYALTSVPPDRQKILGLPKGAPPSGQIPDDFSWKALGAPLKEGATLMLVGTAEELKAPEKAAVFAEDLAEKDLAPMDIDQQQHHAGAAGLHNLGNTCYLNSTLQVLRAVPQLSTQMRGLAAAGGDSNQKLAMAMKELFGQMGASTKAVGPLMFVSLFRSVFPQFNQQGAGGTYKQQDADEAWTALLNLLNQKLPRLPASSSAPSSSAPSSAATIGAVERMFGGEFETKYTCAESEAEPTVVKREPFQKLSCNITINTSHLSECLRDSLKGELEKRSEALGRDARFLKESKIARLPYYVTIQFVRFNWGFTSSVVNKESIAKKIVRPVEFPFVLDLVDYATDELKAQLLAKRKQLSEEEDAERQRRLKEPQDKESLKARKKKDEEQRLKDWEEMGAAPPERWQNETGRYELCGVVTHKGRAADSGHYVGWTRDALDNWSRFDDETVSPVPEDEIKKLSGKGGGDWHIAYILLYRTRKGL